MSDFGKKYKLTAPQKSIMLTEQFYQGTCVNNVGGTANILEKLNFLILEKAMNLFVRNNSSFRIHLNINLGEVKQEITEFNEFSIPIIDVHNINEVKELEYNLINQHFELYNSDLFKFLIFRLPNGTGGFIVNVHHIISDSWTLGLLSREIVELYVKLLNNEDTSKSLDFSYENYISSEQEYFLSNQFEKDKLYWSDIFSTVPELAIFPYSKQTSSTVSCKGERFCVELNRDLIKNINGFCSINHISLYNFFMAIYSIYLGGVSHLNDFVIGTPILNRTNFKEKNTTGMFINIAPLRIKLDNSLSFCDFVSNIAKDCMSMLRHQKYPYQMLLEDLRKSNPNLPNLYSTCISYQVTKAVSNELNFNTCWHFNGTCADDIQIQLFDLNDTGSITIAYDYKINKYSKFDIEVIHNRILHIIKQVLENSCTSISKIELVTPNEKQIILNEFNDTYIDYPKDKTIIDIFEEQVLKTPDDIAIVFETQKLSYKTLNQKVNQLAVFLRKRGIKNNSIVGIMMNRSFEMLISMLAVLKSGGAYIPIDPDYPTDRIEYMVKDSGATLLLYSKEIAHCINDNSILVDLSSSPFFQDSSNIDNPEKISEPIDLSYLIYTSGSTGKPKGVMLTQKSLASFYYAMINKVDYLRDCKNNYSILSITTVSFDIFVFESIISLTCGLTVYLTNNYEQKSTEKLENLVSKNNIDIIQTTPSVMKFHIENLKDKSNFSNLKYVVLAGEPLPKSLVHEIKLISPNCTIYNGYGPSETTIFSTITDVTNLEAITIGHPIANTQIYILDDNLNLLPTGCIGEIYIGGDGVGKGYLYREELTNEKFIPNPFIPNSVMYKTGDLGIWLNDGSILCRGRIDYQVKLRGLRVELGEIEECINSFLPNNILKCAVIIRTINQKEQLVAFISSTQTFELSGLKKYLINYLPNHMVPQQYVMLDNLPHTLNGKIDRNALQNFDIISTQKEIVLPHTQTEKEIFDIIAKLTNNFGFSIEDDFYTIGLDSLDLIRLSAVLLSKYQIEIPIAEFYKLSSIKDLANYIQNTNHLQTSIPKAVKRDYYELSSAQKRIYYSCKIAGKDSLVYNVPGGILINTLLDSKKVEVIFNKLINKYSIFRTYFKMVDNKPYQFIVDNLQIQIDTQTILEKDIPNILENFCQPFELDKLPLLCIKLYQIENKKSLLLLDSHHILLDGTSLILLIKDFCNLYDDKELDSSSIEYIDYSEFEKNTLENEWTKNEVYWKNEFENKDLPILDFPYDYIAPVKRTYEGDYIVEQISTELLQSLKDFATELEVSPYILFLSAWFIILYRYTMQDEIIIGTPSASRDYSNLQNTMGMFVNNIVLKQNIDGSCIFKDFVQNVKSVVTKSFSHQPYPYDKLTKISNIQNHTSLFDVLFTYQNMYEKDYKINNTTATLISCPTHTAKFNLSLEIIPNTCTFNLEYATDLILPSTAKRLLSHYITLLEELTKNKDTKISSIPIFKEEEKNQILTQFNKTSLPYPKNKTLIDLWNETSKKYSNFPAVLHNTLNITYEELDMKSNQLAYQLISHDVKPGDVVGVLLNKSIELVISIWAILKAGGVYLPIYVEYPKDRIEYMLTNSNSKLVITNSSYKNKINIPIHTYTLNSFLTLTNLEELPININHKNTDLAYIIYTSGSTGKPKGVQITHKNLINFITSFTKYYKGINTNDAILSSTNISFDVSIWEIFLPLLNGSKLVLNQEEIISDIVKYCNTITQYNITTLYIPPNILEEVYYLLKDYLQISIKNLLVGVEPIRKSTLNKFYNLNKYMKIVNGYGPTETTVCCTALCFEKETSYNDEIVSIGKPLYNNHIYLLDKNLQPCPIGVPGQIYVSGYGVGNGYINNEKETCKSFCENEFDNLSDKLYCTGDLGKWDEFGNIHYIGRKDNQVKISGYRIELNEIDSIFMQYPYITKCATIANATKTHLTTYFTSDKVINNMDLQTFLQEKLPGYMVPKFLVPIDTFPLTPNGKIDKKKLQEIKPKTTNHYQPPINETQKKLCSIWEKLFNISPIGINDNFFELGGDSLVAIKLQTEALNLDLNISYGDIFAYPTIKQLSKKNTNNIEKLDVISYDYSNIEKLLSIHTVNNITSNIILKDNFKSGILLLGTTGYVGIHILAKLLDNTDSTIYCLIRKKDMIEPKDRLIKTLNFYFGNKYNNYINSRIKIINGDISYTNLGLDAGSYEQLEKKISIVINSAAIVKHFGNYSTFNTINVEGTKNIIKFCKATNKKLYHLSTMSVSGLKLMEEENENKVSFSETNLYIGQALDNVYIQTKFEAEKLIYEEIQNGLNACVFRLGNITNRYSDGKFQINLSENAFVNQVKSICKLGVIQDKFLPHLLELTPVDYTAEAIVSIIKSNPKFYTFHIFNTNFISFEKLLEYINCVGVQIQAVPDKKFKEKIISFLNDESLKKDISGIVTYLDSDKTLKILSNVILNAEFTNKYLKSIDFTWPEIDLSYIRKFFEYFRTINYF